MKSLILLITLGALSGCGVNTGPPVTGNEPKACGFTCVAGLVTFVQCGDLGRLPRAPGIGNACPCDADAPLNYKGETICYVGYPIDNPYQPMNAEGK